MRAKDKRADPPAPGLTERAAAEQAARREREAAALRENLRKRKAQAREREAVHREDTGST